MRPCLSRAASRYRVAGTATGGTVGRTGGNRVPARRRSSRIEYRRHHRGGVGRERVDELHAAETASMLHVLAHEDRAARLPRGRPKHRVPEREPVLVHRCHRLGEGPRYRRTRPRTPPASRARNGRLRTARAGPSGWWHGRTRPTPEPSGRSRDGPPAPQAPWRAGAARRRPGRPHRPECWCPARSAP